MPTNDLTRKTEKAGLESNTSRKGLGPGVLPADT